MLSFKTIIETAAVVALITVSCAMRPAREAAVARGRDLVTRVGACSEVRTMASDTAVRHLMNEKSLNEREARDVIAYLRGERLLESFAQAERD
jgi:hypothetical protein